MLQWKEDHIDLSGFFQKIHAIVEPNQEAL